MTTTTMPTTEAVINSSTTHYIPFTTPFTAPQSCYHLWMGSVDVLGATEFTSFDDQYQQYVDANVSCQPEEVKMSNSFARGDGERTLLMPFSCPGNYEIAGTTTISSSSVQTFCCPRSYTAVLSLSTGLPSITGDCASLTDMPFALTFAMTPSSTTKTATLQTQVFNSTSGYSYTMYASPVMGWNMLPPANAATMTGADIGNVAAGASNSNGGLSTGVKAGIGVAAAVGGIALITALIFLLLYRRKKKVMEQEIQRHRGPTELAGSGSEVQELDERERVEIVGRGLQPPQELAAFMDRDTDFEKMRAGIHVVTHELDATSMSEVQLRKVVTR